MIGIITGDIVNSRVVPATLWLAELKASLNQYGATPQQWEIFRGDSFQLEIQAENALDAAFLIKATIKQYKNLDVRISIGIGEKTFVSDKLTESNGSAFVNSGECFEQLKKTTLAIKTSHVEVDETLNLMFHLAARTFDNWTTVTAFFIKTALLNPYANQKQLAEMLHVEQSNVSRGLNRGGYDEMLKLMEYYQKKIDRI